jgi:hypothetical protein
MDGTARIEAVKRSLAERYSASATLLPDAGQEPKFVAAAAASAAAWNFALERPSESVYQTHKRFKDTLTGPWGELAIKRQAAHCAIRDVNSRVAYGTLPESRDPKTLIQFRAGGRLAFFSSEGLNVGLADAVRMADHAIPLLDVGSPYIVSVRITWAIDDGWRADFLLRDDPTGAIALKALRHGSA